MTEVWKAIQRRRTELQAFAHAEAEDSWFKGEKRVAESDDPVAQLLSPLPVELFAINLAVAREMAALGVR